MNCHAHVDVPARVACTACSAALCGDCAIEVADAAWCRSCLAQRVSAAPPPLLPIRVKSPWLAGFLSVMPGLGQVYNGLVARGFAHFVIFVVLATLTGNSGVLGFFIAFALMAYWVWQVVDAVGTARDINRLGRVPDAAEARALGRSPIPGTDGSSRSLGIALVVVGAVLVLHNLGVIAMLGKLVAWGWPLILVAVGIWLLRRNPSRVEPEGRGVSAE